MVVPVSNPSSTSLGPLIGIGRTAEIYAWGDQEILKLFRPGWPDHLVDMEVRVCTAVHEAGLASPAVGKLVQVNGRKGLIFERIQGPTMLQALAARPWKVWSLARQFADLHAAMHRLYCPELVSMGDRLKRDITHAPRLSEAQKERLLENVAKLPEGSSLCHYDFHPGNVLISPRGPLVIDWMSAVCGSPLADVARTTLIFRMAHIPKETPSLEKTSIQLLRRVFLSTYLARYSQINPLDQEALERHIPLLAAARLVENIPEEEELLLKIALKGSL